MSLLGFIVNDAENCKQEASPGFDTLKIAMSGPTIRKQIENFRIALLAVENGEKKGVNDVHVTFGFHGKFSPPVGEARVS